MCTTMRSVHQLIRSQCLCTEYSRGRYLCLPNVKENLDCKVKPASRSQLCHKALNMAAAPARIQGGADGQELLPAGVPDQQLHSCLPVPNLAANLMNVNSGVFSCHPPFHIPCAVAQMCCNTCHFVNLPPRKKK